MRKVRYRAEREVESGLAGLKRWWSGKYKLPPNHALFLEQSVSELNQEMIEDLLTRKREILSALENDELSMKEQQELSRQMRAILSALGDPVETEDALVDQWERDLEEGRIPDLEA
jgi:hypothetical protein